MKPIFTLLILVFTFNSNAQHGWGQSTADHPEHLQHSETFELNERGGNLKVIPVVVHVIHEYGDENISDEQILSGIEALNEDFSGTNVPLSEIASSFQSIRANAEIEFRLAKLDPSGNCTNGITRTVSALTNVATDNVKDLISWPRDQYLNIWVVGALDFLFQINYSYWPGTEPSPTYDGIITEHQGFGTLGTWNGTNSINYPTGVFLNLLPVWGDGVNTCGDDGVADTPTTDGSLFNCDTNQMTCGSLDNVQNFMDRSTCPLMFTEGQKTRMHATLNSSVSERNNLWTTTNLVATGTHDGFTNDCVPIAELTVSDTRLCEGHPTVFTDYSWNAEVTQVAWTFEGGTPATSSDSSPTVTYQTPGTYDVTLIATSAGGSDTIHYNDLITVTPFGEGPTATINEGMEQAGFPINTDPDLSWFIDPTPTFTWERSTETSVSGTASAMVDLTQVPTGTTVDLISPALDFSWINSDNAQMTFWVAHAPRNGDSDERLRVFVSNNCGENWSIRYSEDGLDLATNGGTDVTGIFIPTPSEWREETVNLGSTVVGEPHILIRFEATSDEQNNLYIDDINIAQGANSISESDKTLKAFIQPNPITAQSELVLDLNTAGKVMLELYDALGRLLVAREHATRHGNDRIGLREFTNDLESGVYSLIVNNGQKTRSLKFVVR